MLQLLDMDIQRLRLGTVHPPCSRASKWPCYAEQAMFATSDCHFRLLEAKWKNLTSALLCHVLELVIPPTTGWVAQWQRVSHVWGSPGFDPRSGLFFLFLHHGQ